MRLILWKTLWEIFRNFLLIKEVPQSFCDFDKLSQTEKRIKNQFVKGDGRDYCSRHLIPN